MSKINTSEFKKNFSDFKSEELIGKTVLYEYGQTYASSYNMGIRKIEKVLKTGFKISSSDNIFDFYGWQKGLSGRMNMGTHSQCYLITDEQADNLRKEWKEQKLKKELFEQINLKLPNCSVEQLQKISEILN